MGEETQGIPERIGRYRVVRPLSKGGMALVYEGRRESLGGVSPPVAIKVILPDYAASSTFRELFINEARLGAAMHHQNLVQILDFDSDGDRYFLVMEYVEGLTLSKIIGLSARHDLKIPAHVICEIGRQACEGLHYAHQAVDSKGKSLNLIHRDIKPSNLIVTPEAGVKILDFGISKGALRAERSGSVKGTWGYMAPEQAMGERIGPNADVFALGIVLYEMASRKSMFKGRSEDEIRHMLGADHAARVSTTVDPSYAPLTGVLGRALHKDPRQRYATAAEFGRQLADLCPDSVTVREEMVRFYRQITELYEREAPRRSRGESNSELTGSSSRRAQFTLDGNRAPATQRAMVVSALIGMIAVVTAFVLGYGLWRVWSTGDLALATPGQIGAISDGLQQGDRPMALPPVQAAPQPSDDGTPAVVEPEPEPPPDAPDLPALRADEGYLELSAVQEAEIYVDGQLARDPGQKRVYKAGRHVVSMVSADGRRVSFVVELQAGGTEQRRWDFERWDWR